MSNAISRRQFGLATGGALFSAVRGEACLVATRTPAIGDGRVTARPRDGVATSLASGPLGLGGDGRDGVIQIPSVPVAGKVPLLVFLRMR